MSATSSIAVDRTLLVVHALKSGVISCSVETYDSGGGSNGVRVYIRGVQVASHTTGASTFTKHTANVTVAKGDIVDIRAYGANTAGTRGYRNPKVETGNDCPCPVAIIEYVST